MKRMTAFILTLMVALCFMIGCELSDPISVGAYKGSTDNWDYVQTQKEYGHRGFNIWNPTTEVIETYCLICHYVN